LGKEYDRLSFGYSNEQNEEKIISRICLIGGRGIMPVILVTQEAVIRRIEVQSQPR
jgi:hypothetical protein